MDAIAAKIESMTSQKIVEGIEFIGGGHVSPEKTLVRAKLLREFEGRCGYEAADELMDRIGM